MKICVIDADYGVLSHPSHVRDHERLASLAQSGFEVHVVCLGETSGSERSEGVEIHRIGLDTVTPTDPGLERWLGLSLTVYDYVQKVDIGIGFDVIELYADDLTGLHLAHHRPLPLVCRVRQPVAGPDGNEAGVGARATFLRRHMVGRAAVVIGESAEAAEWLRTARSVGQHVLGPVLDDADGATPYELARRLGPPEHVTAPRPDLPPVVQVMEALDVGDGVSDIVLRNAELLRGLGQPDGILAVHVHPDLRHLVRPLHDGFGRKALIFHFWGPHGATWLLDAADGPTAAYYHNITPPSFFDYDHDLASSMQRGLQQLDACADGFDLVMAPSRFNLLDFMTHAHRPLPTIVVPPVVEREELWAEPFDVDLVRAIDEQRTTNIVFVGRIAPNKAQHRLVEMFDRYWTEVNRNSRLWLVGSTADGTYTELVRERIERSPARHNVVLTGRVPYSQLLSYFRAATVYVSGSEHEGFGIPLIQAMAFDTPVVALARAGVAETMGGTGVLVDEWDVDRLVRVGFDALAFDVDLCRRVVDTQHENLARFSASEARPRLAAAVRYLRELEPSTYIEWLDPMAVEVPDGEAVGAMSLTCSIVVITHDRAPLVRRLLASLVHLNGPPFEVVVVNGPSSDSTAELLAEYEGVIKVRNCANRNLSESRNIGIAAAAGDIIVFVDDDAYPAGPDWLEAFRQQFEDDPDGRLACVGGSVLHRDGPWYEFNGGATSSYGFQSFLGTPAAQERPPDGSEWFARPPGGNAAYRRSLLVEFGGFDEHYAYYADETDLAHRFWLQGYRCEHLPSNPIRHYSAGSERRRTEFDRNWDVIARSDTYFAMKNGHDRLPRRAYRTARFATDKHFLKQIDGYRQTRQISRAHWLRLRRQWLRGVISGGVSGLAAARRTVQLPSPEAPFVPFASPWPRRTPKRTIALVTQVIPGQPGCGGIGRYTFDLAVALHARGHEVHVICEDEQPVRYHALGFEIHGLSAAAVAEVTRDSGHPLSDRLTGYSLAVVDCLRDLHDRGVDVDVVHLTNWNVEGAAVIRAGLHATALMLVTPLAQVVRTERWDVDDDLEAVMALDRWQVGAADTVCLPSRGVLGSYETLGIDVTGLSRLMTAPLGIDPDRKAIPATHDGRKRLLFVGRLERRKGAEVLLDALPALMERFPEWECHLVGSDTPPLVEGGTLRSRFERDHAGAAWFDRVAFHGEVSEEALLDHYRGCDLFVAPSLFESFGLIFHEAMQYGKAVVGCAAGGVPEVVEHGRNGLLVPPGDGEALADALARLMADDVLRSDMGAAGWQRVQHEQNAITMAAGLEIVYEATIDAVGDLRRARRQLAWGEPMVVRSEGWTELPSIDGRRLHEGRPGACLDVEVPAGSDLLVTVQTDAHGATLVVEQDGEIVERIHTAGPHAELLEHRATGATGGRSTRLRVLDSRLDPPEARVLLSAVTVLARSADGVGHG